MERLSLIMLIFGIFTAIMVCTGVISSVLGVVFIILSLASAVSIQYARPVIRLTIKVRKLNEKVHLEGEIKDVEAELNAENNYETDIRFAEFLQTNSIILSEGDDTDRNIYDHSGGIIIHIERSLFGQFHCDIRKEARPMLNHYLTFSPSLHQRSNKLMAVFMSTIVIGIAVAFCLIFNNSYNTNKENVQENLKHNMDAIVSGSVIDLKEDIPTGEKVYYSELPPVHLIVITKDGNKFIDSESEFNNPEVVNTVLMMYEDNLSGKRYQNDKNQDTAENAGEVEKKYYNMTELYMNLPLSMEDDTICTIGELFSGSVPYDGEIGYNAVKSWFRDIYHIEIASVTEIPETLLSDCFGSENSMSVNLNQDFMRFMYYQYCNDTPTIYEDNSVKEMLAEHKPFFPETLRQHTEELTIRLGIREEKSSLLNAMLFMDGDSIPAFGNTLRTINQSEYQYLKQKQYYQKQAEFPKEEWSTVNLQTIIHSNWDIVMVDLMESISNMNNGTYQVFCRENHADILQQVKTSLSEEEFRQFLESVFSANNVLGNNMQEQTQYVFYVRNLDLHVSSILGENNSYLCKEALKIHPYTNRMVKKSLYYCLREPKS